MTSLWVVVDFALQRGRRQYVGLTFRSNASNFLKLRGFRISPSRQPEHTISFRGCSWGQDSEFQGLEKSLLQRIESKDPYLIRP